MTEVESAIGDFDDGLPHDEDAEQDVIAAALGRPDLSDCLGGITDADFHSAGWARVWRISDMMRRNGRAVGALAVGAAYRRLEIEAGLPDSGAAAVLNDLALEARMMTASEAASAAEVVRSLAARRRLVALHQAAISDALDVRPEESPADLVATAVAALQEVVPPPVETRSLSSVADAVVRRAFDPKIAAKDAIWWGVKELDERTGGMLPGEFVVVAGRPGMGKSLLANRLIRTVAEAGGGVLAIELEMSEEEVAARLIADIARDKGHEVFYSTMRRGAVIRHHADAVGESAEELTRWPLVFEPRPGLTTDQIRQRGREAKRQFEAGGKRLALVVVDHIGHVRASTDRRGNKVAEMTDVSNAMKEMAKELGCVVLGVSQLSRAVESRDEKRPVLSDLRESGSIEQDADTVMLLYREAYYLRHKEATMDPGDYRVEMASCKHTLEVNCAKLRGGEPGVDLVDVDAATGSIRERGRWS